MNNVYRILGLLLYVVRSKINKQNEWLRPIWWYGKFLLSVLPFAFHFSFHFETLIQPTFIFLNKAKWIMKTLLFSKAFEGKYKKIIKQKKNEVKRKMWNIIIVDESLSCHWFYDGVNFDHWMSISPINHCIIYIESFDNLIFAPWPQNLLQSTFSHFICIKILPIFYTTVFNYAIKCVKVLFRAFAFKNSVT